MKCGNQVRMTEPSSTNSGSRQRFRRTRTERFHGVQARFPDLRGPSEESNAADYKARAGILRCNECSSGRGGRPRRACGPPAGARGGSGMQERMRSTTLALGTDRRTTPMQMLLRSYRSLSARRHTSCSRQRPAIRRQNLPPWKANIGNDDTTAQRGSTLAVRHPPPAPAQRQTASAFGRVRDCTTKVAALAHPLILAQGGNCHNGHTSATSGRTSPGSRRGTDRLHRLII